MIFLWSRWNGGLRIKDMILELTQQEGTKSWHQSVVKHKDNIFDTFIEGDNIYIY